MKRHIKLTPLNERGWSHWIAPVLVVALVVVVGVRILTQSHALSAPATTPSVVVAPAKQRITNANNGQTITVRPGTDLVVDLSNVYWVEGTVPAGQSEASMSEWQNFSSSTPTVLSLVGKPAYTLVRSTTSADFNGTSSQTYKALSKGTTTIKASSITEFVCGRGIACPTIAKANYYSVTVHVAGKAVVSSPTCKPKPGYACPL